MRQLGVLQLETHLLADDFAAGEDGDVFQHALAAVAEARGFDGDAGEGAAQLVDHQGGESFAFDVLSDDQQGLARLDDFLQYGEQVLNTDDLLVGDEDVGVFEDRFHPFGVGHEVGGDVALVELHALGELELHAEGLGFLDVDHAVFAHLLDGVGDDVADLPVIGGDGGHASDVFLAGDLLGQVLDLGHGGIHCPLDAPFDGQGIGPGGHVLEAFADDGLSQQGGGGGAVAGDVVGLGGHFAHQLRALVLEHVFELDLAGDGHPVVGDGGAAVFLVKDHVAAFGAEGDLDRVGECVHAALERPAGVFTVQKLFCHEPCLLLATR